MEFTIIAYTRDKEYDPIMLYLSKVCNGRTPPGDHLNCTFVNFSNPALIGNMAFDFKSNSTYIIS